MAENRGEERERKLIEQYREAIAAFEKQPCRCVICDWCYGVGYIDISYDALGRMYEANGDDLDDLEQCDQCHGGIIEMCKRCTEIEELDQQLEEIRFSQQR